MILTFLYPVECAFGQQVLSKNPLHIQLRDGTKVQFLEKTDDWGKYFMYFPTNLQVSLKKDGTPEVSLMTIKSSDDGPVTGALMHLLLRWGLTPQQHEEATKLLHETVDSTANIRRSVALSTHPSYSSFRIISDKGEADILRRSLRSKGGVPLLPGGKLAASFFFKAEEAQAISKAFNKPKDLSNILIRLDFLVSESGFRTEEYHVDLPLSEIVNHLKKS